MCVIDGNFNLFELIRSASTSISGGSIVSCSVSMESGLVAGVGFDGAFDVGFKSPGRSGYSVPYDNPDLSSPSIDGDE